MSNSETPLFTSRAEGGSGDFEQRMTEVIDLRHEWFTCVQAHRFDSEREERTHDAYFGARAALIRDVESLQAECRRLRELERAALWSRDNWKTTYDELLAQREDRRDG